jgi:hypothetical protein
MLAVVLQMEVLNILQEVAAVPARLVQSQLIQIHQVLMVV